MGKVINFVQKEKPELQMNLYDMNKQAMASVDPYDPIILNKSCYDMARDIWREGIHYWMMLCRERNDYTIFRLVNDKNELAKAFVECLTNRGLVLDISKQGDGNYEIWVRDFDTEENVAYYLFNYDNAIIEV